MGEQEAPEGSLYFRFGTAMPSEGPPLYLLTGRSLEGGTGGSHRLRRQGSGGGRRRHLLHTEGISMQQYFLIQGCAEMLGRG